MGNERGDTRPTRRQFLAALALSAGGAAIPLEEGAEAAPKLISGECEEKDNNPESILVRGFGDVMISRELAQRFGINCVLNGRQLIHFKDDEVEPYYTVAEEHRYIGDIITDKPYTYIPWGVREFDESELAVGIELKAMHVPVGQIADKVFPVRLLINDKPDKSRDNFQQCMVARAAWTKQAEVDFNRPPDSRRDLGIATSYGYRFGVAHGEDGNDLVIAWTAGVARKESRGEPGSEEDRIGIYTVPLNGIKLVLLESKNEDTVGETLTVWTQRDDGKFEKQKLTPKVLAPSNS